MPAFLARLDGPPEAVMARLSGQPRLSQRVIIDPLTMYPHHPENSSRHAIAHPAAAGAALSDAFLGKIYRATSDEARRLFLALDEADRARLALFCNGKAHLRGHGRAIATACTLESLISEAGQADRILFDQAGVAPDRWGAVAHLPKQISFGGVKLNAALTTSR